MGLKLFHPDFKAREEFVKIRPKWD